MHVAVNQHIVGKDVAAVGRHNSDWKNFSLDQHELATVVAELKWAVCAQVRGARRSANVLCTGFLAVDVDEGLTIEDVEADAFFKQHASILYRTASHRDDAHRFRIIFELEQPLADVGEIQLALTGLIFKFGGDKACSDAARIFFGNADPAHKVYGNILPHAEVLQLIAHAREKTLSQRYSSTGNRSTRVRSRIAVPVDIQVRTKAGLFVPLWELTAGTPVFCPQHVDTRPSAFVVHSSSGKPGISCSACLVTMFPEGFEPSSTNDYLDLDLERLVRSFGRKEAEK